MEEHRPIRWRRGPNAVMTDQAIMTKWADGKIDTEEATARMNEANGWRITPEQFVEAAQSLGYRRFVKWNNTYERWMTDRKALEAYEERKAAERAKRQAEDAYEEIAKAVRYV